MIKLSNGHIVIEKEIVEYINENAYEFELKDGSEGSLVDEIMFGKDIVKDKQTDIWLNQQLFDLAGNEVTYA